MENATENVTEDEFHFKCHRPRRPHAGSRGGHLLLSAVHARLGPPRQLREAERMISPYRADRSPGLPFQDDPWV